MDDLLRELQQFQHQTRAMGGLLAEALALTPQRSEGQDARGAVTAMVGADGCPRSIKVAGDWRDRLAPEDLHGAVLEAVRAATDARLAAWATALEADGWQDKVERLEESIDGTGSAAPSSSDLPTAFSRSPARPGADAASQVSAEIVMSRSQLQWGAGVTGEGSSAAGRISVLLSRDGLESLSIDTGWLAGQSGRDLTAAFREALAAARAGLRRPAR